MISVACLPVAAGPRNRNHEKGVKNTGTDRGPGRGKACRQGVEHGEPVTEASDV